jgi:hypothetical protein
MENSKEKIEQEYAKYLRENGKRPNTVFAFCAQAGLDEKEFYKFYSSFNHIERTFWKKMYDNTLLRVKAEPVYEEYGTREKFLSFFYTLVEVLKEERSFLLAARLNKYNISLFKEEFINYAKFLVNEGISNNEIESRVFFSSKYADLIWFQTDYIIQFWLKDESSDFEKTDAAIEKAVNLIFDIFSKNIADSAFDFVKFAFQNRK